MQCPSCGTTGEGRFCSGCGAPFPESSTTDPAARYWDEATAAGGGSAGPPGGWSQPPGPPPRGPRRWPFIVLGVLVLGVLGVVVWMVTAPDNRVEADGSSSSAASTSSSSSSASSSESSTPTTSTTTTTTTSTSSSSSSSSSSESASDQLSDLHSDSLDGLDRNGDWGVTLSAKYDGIRDDLQTTEDGSHVFHEDDILALHEDLEEVHGEDGQVYLVTSDDLESTATEDYADTLWMTILDPGGLDSRRQAVAWCERAFPEVSGDELQNACYPRELTAP
ncbi:MAG: hypothetical protein ACTMHL_00510 [Janibacter sp.]